MGSWLRWIIRVISNEARVNEHEAQIQRETAMFEKLSGRRAPETFFHAKERSGHDY